MFAIARRCCAILFVIPFLLGPVVAQEPSRVEGRVTKAGKGFGAVVVLIHELKRAEVSGADGRFAFEKVPAGTYNLVLTLGENTAIHQLIVPGGETTRVEYVVDWEAGGFEEVTVTAVEMAAKIVDAPAAITSIPVQQIEQQASHGQVPKILEFTPGAEVTQSGLYDFNFNTRGFNSSLNRRVSTYIDGRDVGVVLLGAQEWAAISGGLDDVASLEFIRGPSAALYGANASSGVVNITTKAPRSSLGSLLRITRGQLETRNIDFRVARELGKGWYWKGIFGVKNSGDYTTSRNPDGPDRRPATSDDLRAPEYSEFCLLIGETDCLPRERTLFRTQHENGGIHARNEIVFGALRFDKYLGDKSVLTFESGISTIKGPVFQTGIGRVQNLDSERPFFRFAYSNPHWNVLGHYTLRDGHQVNLVKALVVDFDLYTDDQRYGVETQGNWNFLADKLRFVIGAAHTQESVDTIDPRTGKQTVTYKQEESHRQAVFSQLDWRASERFKVVFAGRVDQSTLHTTQFSPKAAVVFSINPTNSIRATFNRAFQVANYSEFFLHTKISDFPIGGFVRTICGSPVLPQPVDCGIVGDFVPILAVGNDDLRLEKTQAWELGYSGVLASKVFMTLDYYRSKNKDFITDLVPQVGTILGNLEGCFDQTGAQILDPKRCPINNDYRPWVSTDQAETTILFGSLTVAQALRNAVDNSVGGNSLGFRLAKDLNGDTVVVGRTYTNVGLVNTQGVDFGLQYFITPSVSLQASYSWFDFEIIDAGEDLEDLQDILLPNTPEHKVSMGFSLTRKNWTLSTSGRWVQGFRWSAGVFQGEVDRYSTVDVAASVRLNKMMRLGLNVANARDSVHRQTFGGDLLTRRALLNLTMTW